MSGAALRLCWAVVGLASLASIMSLSRPAHAEPATESYEAHRLKLFLGATGLHVDPAPEGKRIAYVRFERREVFEPDDLAVPLILPRFASTWPNAFHWLTTESRIRSELLLREGIARGELPDWLDVDGFARGFMALLDGLLLQRIEAGDAYRPEESVRRANAILDVLLAVRGAERQAVATA